MLLLTKPLATNRAATTMVVNTSHIDANARNVGCKSMYSVVKSGVSPTGGFNAGRTANCAGLRFAVDIGGVSTEK